MFRDCYLDWPRLIQMRQSLQPTTFGVALFSRKYNCTPGPSSSPFILEVLDRADVTLTAEIVEVLYGMARGTKPDFWKMGNVPSWALQLRQALQAELPRFLKMKDSGANEDLRDCASCIVDALSPG